jgi:hypothetical protein
MTVGSVGRRNEMLRVMVVTATAALVTAGAWAAVAGTGGGRTPVNCVDTVWRTGEVSTSSTAFTKVPGFSDSPSSIFPIVVNVSALVSGAPVEFRILSTNEGSQTGASEPGRTRFVPTGGGADPFSYQWVEPNQSAAVHVNDLRLQWRSPSGRAVHVLGGDMSVAYSTEPGSCTS